MRALLVAFTIFQMIKGKLFNTKCVSVLRKPIKIWDISLKSAFAQAEQRLRFFAALIDGLGATQRYMCVGFTVQICCTPGSKIWLLPWVKGMYVDLKIHVLS